MLNVFVPGSAQQPALKPATETVNVQPPSSYIAPDQAGTLPQPEPRGPWDSPIRPSEWFRNPLRDPRLLQESLEELRVMSPDSAPLFRASAAAAKKVKKVARDHGRNHPLYHEANLASMTADAGLFEAAILYEAEKRPVCTQRVAEYRAMLALDQGFRDGYRRRHIPGGSHGWFTVTLTAYAHPAKTSLPKRARPAISVISHNQHCMNVQREGTEFLEYYH